MSVFRQFSRHASQSNVYTGIQILFETPTDSPGPMAPRLSAEQRMTSHSVRTVNFSIRWLVRKQGPDGLLA